MNSAIKYFALASVILTAPVSAQILETSGQPGSELSKIVKVKSTIPSLQGCKDHRFQGSCFRIMFELTPEVDGDVGISVASGLKGFDGYSATGNACQANLVRGMQYGAWNRNHDKWDQKRLTYSNRTRPAILVVDFVCDGPVLKNEEVTFQANFHYYVNAANFGEARYMFSRAKIH